MTKNKVATVLLSGGIDSAACAHFLQSRDLNVNAIFLAFGQPAEIYERTAARAVADHLDIPLQEVSITNSNSFSTGEIRGRNGFLIFAALISASPATSFIGMGIHAGTNYFDCSDRFAQRTSLLIEECTKGLVAPIFPFLNWEKIDVYEYFHISKIPLEITHSCESGTGRACKICQSCMDLRLLRC